MRRAILAEATATIAPCWLEYPPANLEGQAASRPSRSTPPVVSGLPCFKYIDNSLYCQLGCSIDCLLYSSRSVFPVDLCALHQLVDVCHRRGSRKSAARPQDKSTARRKHLDRLAAGSLYVLNRSLMQYAAGIDGTQQRRLSRRRPLGHGLVALVIELQ